RCVGDRCGVEPVADVTHDAQRDDDDLPQCQRPVLADGFYPGSGRRHTIYPLMLLPQISACLISAGECMKSSSVDASLRAFSASDRRKAQQGCWILDEHRVQLGTAQARFVQLVSGSGEEVVGERMV